MDGYSQADYQCLAANAHQATKECIKFFDVHPSGINALGGLMPS